MTALKALHQNGQHRPLAGAILPYHPARQAGGEAIEGELVELIVQRTGPAMVLGEVELLSFQLIDQTDPVELAGQRHRAQHQLVLRLSRCRHGLLAVGIERIVVQARLAAATRQQAQQGQRQDLFFIVCLAWAQGPMDARDRRSVSWAAR